MKTYRSAIGHSVPLLFGAVVLALMALLGLVLGTLGGPLQIPGIIEKVCVLLISGVLGWAAWVCARIALADYFVELAVDERGLRYKKPFKQGGFDWSDLKTVSSTDSTVTLSTRAGEHLDVGASLSGYQEFREEVEARYREIKTNR